MQSYDPANSSEEELLAWRVKNNKGLPKKQMYKNTCPLLEWEKRFS